MAADAAIDLDLTPSNEFRRVPLNERPNHHKTNQQRLIV
jgi:hypothetical protein